MRAAWFESIGAPEDVLQVGERPDPEAGPGEVRVRIHVSAVNPGDIKKRDGTFGPPAFPLIIPHSDGAGVIDGGPRDGERVWVFNAQSGRPFGTAAELCVVPDAAAVRLPDDVDFVTGAALGIPARTAHRAVFCAGPVRGQTVLVAGGAGSVGRCAVELARWGGAEVIATVGGEAQAEIARAAGAFLVLDYKRDDVAAAVLNATSGRGVDHVIEVDLARNIGIDARVIAMGGSLAAFATSEPAPSIPFWDLVFRAVTLTFVGVDSDPARQTDAVADLADALARGLLRPLVAERLPLDQIARAHALVERGVVGKVFVDVTS
jgi:NADPH2:quinone reductase